MVFDRGYFNEEFISKYETVDLFLESPQFKHIWKKLPDDVRREKLTELYKIAKIITNAHGK